MVPKSNWEIISKEGTDLIFSLLTLRKETYQGQ
jgi:hypothetical protein